MDFIYAAVLSSYAADIPPTPKVSEAQEQTVPFDFNAQLASSYQDLAEQFRFLSSKVRAEDKQDQLVTEFLKAESTNYPSYISSDPGFIPLEQLVSPGTLLLTPPHSAMDSATLSTFHNVPSIDTTEALSSSTVDSHSGENSMLLSAVKNVISPFSPMEIPVPALQARAPTHNRSASCGSLRKRRDAVYVPHEYAQAARVQYTLDTIIEKDSYFADYYEDSTANKENMEQRPFKRTDISESKSGNRGYSKRVNMILSTWLENNRNNPYPTPAQRQMLMRETELTKMQLKNWFCNIRRRKLPHTIRRPKKSSFCDF